MNAEKIIERHEKMMAARTNWNDLWQEISEYVMPSRGHFVSHQDMGERRGTRIFDSTAVNANQVLAAHIHSSLTSPSTKWFNLRFDDEALNNDDAAMEWLEEAGKKMLDAFSQSNFSTQASECYQDLCAFGTSVLFSEAASGEDFKLQFRALHLGSICIAEDYDGIVDTVFHKRLFSARQVKQRWPDSKLPRVEEALETEPDKAVAMLHCVVPNPKASGEPTPPPNRRPYIAYWVAMEDRAVVEESGFFEMPYLVPRWSKVTGDLYGYGPGLLARADIRTINEAKKLELVALEKSIDPPMMASATGIIGDLHLESAGLTFVRDMNSLAPLVQRTEWEAVQIKSQELRESINAVYLLDQLVIPERTNQTATEVQIRYELMHRVLGPTMGRLQTEFLNPLVERVFGLMYRNNQFSAPPDSIGDGRIDVEYQGPLARNQRVEEATSIERLFGIAAQYVQFSPDAMDIVDVPGAMRVLAERYGVPAAALKSEAQVKQAVDARNQKQQAAEMMQMQSMQAQMQATQAGGMKDAASAAQTQGELM